MHKRMQQLAEQAGMYVDIKGEPWPKWMSSEECEVAYKRFAELIAYECIDLALGSSHREDDMGAIIANKIKTHFGVEE